jgi:hypothetical protein
MANFPDCYFTTLLPYTNTTYPMEGRMEETIVPIQLELPLDFNDPTEPKPVVIMRKIFDGDKVKTIPFLLFPDGYCKIVS